MKLRNLNFHLRSIVAAFILLIGGSIFAAAQDRGTFNGYTAPSFEVGPTSAAVDSISLFNGNLNISLPFLGVGGRGKAGHSVGRTNSIKWGMQHQWLDGHYQHFIHRPSVFSLDGNSASYAEISYSPGAVEVKRSYIGNPNCYPDTYSSSGENWRIVFSKPDGNVMEFISQQGQADAYSWCPNGPTIPNTNFGTVFKSFDGSFATVVLDAPAFRYSTNVVNGYLMFPDGTKYRVENSRIVWVRDKNGNVTTFTWALVQDQGYKIIAAKDSIGRETTFEYKIQNNDQYGLHDRVTYKGTNGATRIFRVSFRPMGEILRAGQSLQTKGALFDFWDHWGGANEILNLTRVSAIWLPNGKAYKFFYNSYAEVARLELPQGGAFEYDWGASLLGGDPRGLIGVEPWEPIAGYSTLPDVNRRVLEKRIYPNGEAGSAFTMRITYSQTEGQGTSTTHNTVKTFDALGSLLAQQKHYFNGTPILQTERHPFSLPNYLEGAEFKTEVFDVVNNSPVLKQRIEKTWVSSVGGPRDVETITTLVDTNQVAKTTSINPIDGSVGFDQFNNQTDLWEYDYGIGAPGTTLVRRTHTDFVTDANYTSHAGAYLLRLPSQTWVSSDVNGGTKAARTQFEYDNYVAGASHAPLLDRSNVAGHDTTGYGTSKLIRGNVTKVTSYANAQTQTGAVNVYSQYDILGNVVKTIDANGNAWTIDYSDSFGTPDGDARANIPPVQLNGQSTFAFPTKIIYPAPFNWISFAQYDYFTGQPVNAEDINGVISKTIYNDPLERPTQTVTAIGSEFEAQSSTTYEDTNRRIEIKSDLNALGDNLLKSESFYDGLGRTFEVRKYESDGGYVATKTEYDALSRVNRVTNPYRPLQNETVYWTESFYDALNRVTKVRTSDNAEVNTAYSGNTIAVTDQAGKQRRSVVSVFGQLVRLDEPDSNGNLGSISAPNQPTNYAYDALNNLTAVNQGVQTRTFTYNSLSRLLSTTNPESGAINYVYDPNGNLTQKTDARGVVTDYVYDALNRVTNRNYSTPNGTPGTGILANYQATPNVTNTYDDASVANSKGRLTKVMNVNSTIEYTEFDIPGRVRTHKQTTDGTAYTTGYIYNLGGTLIEETYPSGRVVKNTLDATGDLQQVQSMRLNDTYRNYANGFTYTAAGAVSSMRLGNGKWESTQFNSRLQPTQIGLGSSATSQNLLKLNYDYGNADNNGNVKSQIITTPNAAFTQTYQYDSLNRLVEAKEVASGSQTWKQNFGYDRFGNRISLNEYTGINLTNNQTPQIDPTNNRFTTSSGFVYDLSGNVLTDNLNRSFSYDGENKQTKVLNNQGVAIGEYKYDGNGSRVKKIVGNDVTIFVYDAASKLVAEYSTESNSNPRVNYATADTLASPRIITNQTGDVISRRDFRPYGEELVRTSYGTDSVRRKFTTYDRDNETDLDFAQARYNNSDFGRFSSPDPLMASAKTGAPQTWNRYIYVINNPLKYVDPTGMILEGSGSRCDFYCRVKSGEATKSDLRVLAWHRDNNTPFWQSISGAYNEWQQQQQQQQGGRITGASSGGTAASQNSSAPADRTQEQAVLKEYLRDSVVGPHINFDTLEFGVDDNGKVVATFLFKDPEKAVAVLKAAKEQFKNAKLGRLHKNEVGEKRSKDVYDFRSYTVGGSRLGDKSLQINIGRNTGLARADLDRFNPRQDLVGGFGHIVLEIIPGWFR
ncbi:MAG: RHS repeat domain-containing protein [Pyrinomonadaceae bacterium]